MSRTEDARGRLFDVLTPLLPDGRVRRYCPAQVVAPCIWIDAEELSTETQGRSTFTVARFPIVVAVDGATDAAQRILVALKDAVWDSANTVGRCERADPGSIDPGAPRIRPQGPGSLRSYTVFVDMTITARTLCELPAQTTPAWPVPNDQEAPIA